MSRIKYKRVIYFITGTKLHDQLPPIATALPDHGLFEAGGGRYY